MSYPDTDKSTRAARAFLDGADDGAQNALNKMARAYRRGTGCRLSAEEIKSLNLTRIGEMWAQPDPRTEQGAAA